MLADRDVNAVDGILLDLGLSSDQLADHERGFSFHSEGSLDLRFDPTRGEPAWKLLERLSEEHLANVLFELGEERYSRRIARQIVRTAEAVAGSEPRASSRSCCDAPCRGADTIASAPRDAFVSGVLRIAVNEELKWLTVALRRLPDCLAPGGRRAIISFHSLEDRLVKEGFRDDY